MGSWFDQFPPFTHDPSTGLRSNFNRLAAQRHWGKKLQRTRWTQCQIFEFGRLYGDDEDVGKLEKWQDLCREVRVEQVPGSVTQCKKVRVFTHGSGKEMLRDIGPGCEEDVG